MEKMTYVAALNYVLENVTDLPEAVADKLTALKAQTEKRNAADRKPTKAQMANEVLKGKVLEVLTADPAMTEVVEKLTALRDQTEKRNSAERKPTKAQLANEGLKAKVAEVLTADPATVTEIMARDAELATLSNQKVSALVNALVDEGKAVKTVEKRKSYFARA